MDPFLAPLTRRCDATRTPGRSHCSHAGILFVSAADAAATRCMSFAHLRCAFSPSCEILPLKDSLSLGLPATPTSRSVQGVAKLRTVCACSGPDGVALIIFGSAIGEAAVVAASDQPLLRNAAGGGMAASSVERDDFGGSRQQQLFPSGGRRLREEEDLRAGEALSALSLEDCQGAD